MKMKKHIIMIIYYNLNEKVVCEKVSKKIYKVNTLICINRQKIIESIDWAEFSLLFSNLLNKFYI